MGIDAAGRHDAAGSVDLASTARQAEPKLRDTAADDTDVGHEDVARGGHAGIAHHQIEAAHRAPR